LSIAQGKRSGTLGNKCHAIIHRPVRAKVRYPMPCYRVWKYKSCCLNKNIAHRSMS
jgi:hypothetical protein